MLMSSLSAAALFPISRASFTASARSSAVYFFAIVDLLCGGFFFIISYFSPVGRLYFYYTGSQEPAGTATPVAIEKGTGFSQNGSAVTRDLLYDKHTNKQFIAVETRNGHTLYLVIDYDKPLDEDGDQYETYFLSLVDESDLLALIDEDSAPVCSCKDKCEAGAVNTACAVCKTNMTECMGKEKATEKTPEPDPTPDTTDSPDKDGGEKKSGSGLVVIVLLLLIAGGGALYWFKFRKKKPDTKGPVDLDDYDYGDEDEDEEYENEDDADEPEETEDADA